MTMNGKNRIMIYGPKEDGTYEVRLPEVRPPEVSTIEVAEVRADVGVLVTPRVPDFRPLLEDRDVLVVGHRSIPRARSAVSKTFSRRLAVKREAEEDWGR